MKYKYYKVIQQNYSAYYGWEDVDFYEVNSTGTFKDKQTRNDYLTALINYKLLGLTRTIIRRELNN